MNYPLQAYGKMKDRPSFKKTKPNIKNLKLVEYKTDTLSTYYPENNVHADFLLIKYMSAINYTGLAQHFI